MKKRTVIGVFVDDLIHRIIFESLFERCKNTIEGYVFTTPEEGIEKAMTKSFDVVFVEIHFRGENFGGGNILQKLKPYHADKLIAIGMISLLQEGDIEKIVRQGFSMCIEKPISLEALQKFCAKEVYN